MRGARTLARRLAVVALVVATLHRPTWGDQEVAGERTALSVVVVFDRSTSMGAMDVDGRPRVDRARADVRTIVGTLEGARFALIGLATDVEVVIPFTSDREAMEHAVDSLDLEPPANAGGSRLDRPVAALRQLLREHSTRAPGRHAVVVVVSDGEDTAPGRRRSFTAIRDLVDAGVVLGYGTTQGGRMYVAGPDDARRGLVLDPSTGRPAVSRASPDNLRRAAEELGVPYEHRADASGIDEVVRELRADDPGVEATLVVGRDVTWVAAGLAALLLLVELRAPWMSLVTSWRRGRRSRGSA